MKPEEEKLWSTVGVNDMSDEEDCPDGTGFTVTTPEDRPQDVRDLITNLDQRHKDRLQKEQRNVLKVQRIQK